MAASSASFVRAAADRSRALTLDHIFSIGFRSGLYGGRYRTVAPAASTVSRTAATLWAARLSMTTTSPGVRAGTSTCSRNVRNASASAAPAMVMAPRMPPTPTAPTTVVVFQWPWGVRPGTRSPGAARPWVRAIFVLHPVSSTNTSRAAHSAARARTSAAHPSRAAFTSGRSRSLAASDFFSAAGQAAAAVGRDGGGRRPQGLDVQLDVAVVPQREPGHGRPPVAGPGGADAEPGG